MRKVRVIDSHTEGEPTRLVMHSELDSVAEPTGATMAERVATFNAIFESEFRPLLLEPRSYEAVVGAWLGPATAPDCLFDLIFFNPTGILGMCGHGTIGIAATLAQMGQLNPGTYKFNTPVGIVFATLVDHATVQIQNVPAYRIAHQITISVPDFGPVVGDVAYGGNHFFLVKQSPIEVKAENIDAMLTFTKAVMAAARDQGYPDVNHVELYGTPTLPNAHSKNFVLCPGGEYDRSPCGTGTSAKLACLAADGKLAPMEQWVQESTIGTSFTAWYQEDQQVDRIIPIIEGRAYITGENTLLFHEGDPLSRGILK